MDFVSVGEQTRHRRVDLVVQRGGVAGTADGDAVSRPGELEVVDCGVANGGGNFCHGHFARLVPGVGKCWVVAVTPESRRLIRVQRVDPSVLGILEHKSRLLRNVPVAANSFFAPIDWSADLIYPAILSAEIQRLRNWINNIRER